MYSFHYNTAKRWIIPYFGIGQALGMDRQYGVAPVLTAETRSIAANVTVRQVVAQCSSCNCGPVYGRYMEYGI